MKDLNDVIAAAVLKAVTQANENQVDESSAGPAVFDAAAKADELGIYWESGAGDAFARDAGTPAGRGAGCVAGLSERDPLLSREEIAGADAAAVAQTGAG